MNALGAPQAQDPSRQSLQLSGLDADGGEQVSLPHPFAGLRNVSQALALVPFGRYAQHQLSLSHVVAFAQVALRGTKRSQIHPVGNHADRIAA